jgi:hypothetical protein
MDSFASVHDIIQSGNGVIVPNNDIAAFYAATLSLMQNNDILTRFAQTAIQTSGRYAPNEITSQWKTLFQQLLSKIQ